MSKANDRTNYSNYVNNNNSALHPSGPEYHTAICHLAAQIRTIYLLPTTATTGAKTVTNTTLPASLPPPRTPPPNLRSRPPIHAPPLRHSLISRPASSTPPPPPEIPPPQPRPPTREPPNLQRIPSPPFHIQHIPFHGKFWQLCIRCAEIFGKVGRVAERGGEKDGG